MLSSGSVYGFARRIGMTQFFFRGLGWIALAQAAWAGRILGTIDSTLSFSKSSPSISFASVGPASTTGTNFTPSIRAGAQTDVKPCSTRCGRSGQKLNLSQRSRTRNGSTSRPSHGFLPMGFHSGSGMTNGRTSVRLRALAVPVTVWRPRVLWMSGRIRHWEGAWPSQPELPRRRRGGQ